MKKGLHRLMYLNTGLPPVGGIFLESYGGLTLLKEVCSQGRALRDYSVVPQRVCSLCFLSEVEEVSSQLSVPAPFSHTPLPMWFGTRNRNKLFCKLPWSHCFVPATGKKLIQLCILYFMDFTCPLVILYLFFLSEIVGKQTRKR